MIWLIILPALVIGLYEFTRMPDSEAQGKPFCELLNNFHGMLCCLLGLLLLLIIITA